MTNFCQLPVSCKRTCDFDNWIRKLLSNLSVRFYFTVVILYSLLQFVKCECWIVLWCTYCLFQQHHRDNSWMFIVSWPSRNVQWEFFSWIKSVGKVTLYNGGWEGFFFSSYWGPRSLFNWSLSVYQSFVHHDITCHMKGVFKKQT